ncbi:MAG: DUF4923 family protein [Rikenellaceae bacterium]
MNRSKLLFATFALFISSFSLHAQSLSDIISAASSSDVVSSVTGGITLSNDKIVGEWDYVQPAVELDSDSVVSTAAGSLVSSQIEAKLSTYCTKVGIKAGSFAFVFGSGNTFTSNIGSKQLSGTYTIDAESGTITFNYSASTLNIGKLTANATLTSSSLSLLFNADKLLSLFSALGSSSNEELQLLSSLSEQYNGLKLGFELKGEVVESASSTTDKVESAIDAVSKWF